MQNLVTVFGGSGFIGAQVVRALAKAGFRIRVAVRQPNLAYAMRLRGDVGQIDVVQANIRNEASVRRALEGASIAINLVGVLYEAGRQKFDDVHTEGTRTVAEVAKAMGVERLIQMSALGADANSPSHYARSKAAGEAAALAAFPDAVIVRPSIVFGVDDKFFNKFAAMAAISPALPLVGGGHTKFQPVFVGDVAQAIAALASDPNARGVYELGGRQTLTFKELLELMLAETDRRRLLLPLPFGAAKLIGAAGDMVSGLITPPLTSDQVELLRADNVVTGAYPGLPELGITAATLQAVLPTYLYRYRKGGQYADQEDREMAAL